MFPVNENVYSSLYRWVEKHDENFLSESLAYVIRNLFKNSPQAALKFLSLLLNRSLDHEFSPDQVHVTAQMYTDKHGTPDMWIDLPDLDVAIEVKVDASVGVNQLSSYRDELNRRSKANQCLIFISRHIASEEAKDADVSLRWFQVADALDACLAGESIDPVTEFITSQFIDHLRFRRLAFAPMRTRLSKGIKDHLESENVKLILTSRVRNLNLLLSYNELEPLHHLLSLMRAAIDTLELDDTPILDSGQTPTPWIGYNLQGMKYFFYIYLTRPEELIFETSYRFEINPQMIGQLEIGRFVKKGKFDAWEIQFDLLDSSHSFFSLASDQQIEILVSFLKNSYENAITIEASA